MKRTGPSSKMTPLLPAAALLVCVWSASPSLLASGAAHHSQLSQAAALMAIFNATGGHAHWQETSGWGTGSPCPPAAATTRGRASAAGRAQGRAAATEWYGVCCRENASDFTSPACSGAQTGMVTGIILKANGLEGELPSSPGVWAALSRLQTLVLRSNHLTGGIPDALGLLSPTELVDVNLRRNALTSPLPSGLGRLRSLVHFSIFDNAITGPLPADIVHFAQNILYNMARLAKLGPTVHGGFDLCLNNMSGAIPPTTSDLFVLMPAACGGQPAPRWEGTLLPAERAFGLAPVYPLPRGPRR